MLYASISTAAIFISCILGATLLLFQRKKKAPHFVWAALSYTVGVWALGLCLTINAKTYGSALFWGRFHNYVAILIIPLFVHFVYALIGQRSKVVSSVYLYFCALLAWHAIFFEEFIPSVRSIGDFNFYIQAGPHYWIFLTSYFSLTTFGALRLAVALPKTTGLKRKQFTYVLAAFSLGFIGGGTTFPMVYGINIYPFGLGATVAYVLLITYTIVQHRFFEVSALVANALSVMLAFLVLTGGYVFAWQAYSNFFTDRTSTTDLVLNLLYLAFACESYFVVRPKLQAFNKALLIKRHYNYAKIRDSLAMFGEDLLEPQALMQQANQLLRKDLKLPVAYFFVSKKLLKSGQTETALMQWSIKEESFSPVVMTGLEQKLLELTYLGVNTTIDEADTNLKGVMELLGAGMFLPFMSGNELLGMAFVTKRKGADLYTSDDFLVFDLLSSKIKASLSRALSHLQSKNALLSLAGSIAHEMRNPLGQIKYTLDTIGHTLPSPTTSGSAQSLPAQELNTLYNHLSQGQVAIKRGLQVISMTLDEVSAKPLDTTKFVYLSAAKTTQKAVDEYSFETEGERSKVKVVVVNDFTFKGDETAYIFVLFNLIKNALYYFKQKPTATITLTIDAATVRVRDTGPGIPENVRTKLFQAFATSGKVGGTGLGLSYCQRTMQAFGGSITCDSVVGEYTEFALHFVPIAEDELKIRQAQFLQCAQPFFQGKHILVVDDSAPQRALTSHMLEDLDCQVDEADNGQAALDKLAQNHYDLIVMDLNMPVLDGYATAEKIRSGVVPQAKDIPIVAHTSESAYMASVKTQKVGMNGFVGKPCTQIELIEALQQALGGVQPQIAQNQNILEGKTLLIADDVDMNREIVAHYAERWGMKVLQADSGEEAIQLLQQQSNPIDIVLMDMQMPGMGGVAATQTLRQQDQFQHLPILALTGNSDEHSMEEAKAAGMNGFISKPFEMNDLQGKLTQQLSQQQSLKVTSSAQPTSTTADQPTPAPSSAPIKHTKPYPPLQDISLPDLPLLNLRHLDEFKARAPDFLVEEWPAYLDGFVVAQERLHTALAQQNYEDLHRTLHSLMGNSGNAGAFAMHQFLKCRVAPDVETGHWPREEKWLETLTDLSQRTQVAMREYLAQIKVPPAST